MSLPIDWLGVGGIYCLFHISSPQLLLPIGVIRKYFCLYIVLQCVLLTAMVLWYFHRKKRSTIILSFSNIFYPRLKKFFVWKSNGKLLSNCNRNCQGRTLCLNWLRFLPCTLCTYWDRGFQQLDKKRSSPIIIPLYVEQYISQKVRSTLKR